MSKQHPNVKALRQVRLNARLNMPDSQVDALDWAIRVCEAADALINVKGRHHSETAYRRLKGLLDSGESQDPAVWEQADSNARSVLSAWSSTRSGGRNGDR